MHPVLLKTPFFTIYSYGVCVALAVALSLWISSRRAPAFGLSSSDSMDILLFGFIAGIAGARAAFVIQSLEYFQGDWLAMVMLQQGGLVWYGGFMASVLAAALVCRFKKAPVPRWADFYAPVLAMAHAIGRVGCFMNGCCAGKKYPVQLFEATGLAVISFFLFKIAKKNRPVGNLFALYVLLYAVMRFFLEFLREGQGMFNGLTLPQWTSLVFIGFAVTWLSINRKRAKR